MAALISKADFRDICKKGVILMAVWIGTLLDAATGATEFKSHIRKKVSSELSPGLAVFALTIQFCVVLSQF